MRMAKAAQAKAAAGGGSSPEAEGISGVAVRIDPPALVNINVTLVGLTPLISHNFSNKSRREMLEKQQKKTAKARAVRDPEQEFLDSLYVIDPNLPVEDRYGFPCAGFKGCAVSACRNLAGIPMTLVRGAFHVMGNLVPIQYERLDMREDVIRLNGRTADLRYRGEFHGWRVTLPIRLNIGVVSAEQLLSLYETAGFAVGIGDYRPEKSGVSGMFEVARD